MLSSFKSAAGVIAPKAQLQTIYLREWRHSIFTLRWRRWHVDAWRSSKQVHEFGVSAEGEMSTFVSVAGIQAGQMYTSQDKGGHALGTSL